MTDIYTERPYSESTDVQYGAWETDDIEEHAFDMLAVVKYRRDHPHYETHDSEPGIDLRETIVSALREGERDSRKKGGSAETLFSSQTDAVLAAIKGCS